MKNLLVDLLSVFLTILYLRSARFVGAVDPRYKNCSIFRRCGCQPISFPFYIEEEHNYCQYQGFHLSCDDNNGYPRPILKLYSDDYIVHYIFYYNQSLVVSNAAFSFRSIACFPPLRNLSLTTGFALAFKQSNATLLQNCSPSSDLLKYRIGCSAKNDAKWVLAFPEKDKNQVANAYEKCGIGSSEVEFPVAGYRSKNEEMGEVLSRGFMLNWVASDLRTLCGTTGGKCGFDFRTFRFKCYCPDRPHDAFCNPPS